MFATPEVTELREVWPALTLDERSERFHHLPWPVAEVFFRGLEAHDQAEIVCRLPRSEQQHWLRILAPDDVADVIQEAAVEEHAGLFGGLKEPVREEVLELLAYAEDHAGGLMNPRFAHVQTDMTRDEAMSILRQRSQEHLGMPYYVYVLDRGQQLLGVVSFWELFTAPTGEMVHDLMHTDVLAVPEVQDQEAVAAIMA